MSEQDVEYWRELAAQYQRELEALRARVLRYLDAPQPENAAALLCAAKALPGWMEELDRIAPELQPAEVQKALEDLWTRARVIPSREDGEESPESGDSSLRSE